MNTMDPIITSDRGIILTDNVNLEWLRELTPMFHPNFVKFVINKENNKVAVGMNVHKDAQILLGANSEENIYGGNIFLKDGSIVYESTLNVDKNIKSKWFKKHPGNPRIITDPELIAEINSVLLAWVEL